MEEKKTSYLYELEKKGQEQEKRERLNKTIEELNNELNGIVDKAYQLAIGKVVAAYQEKLNDPDLTKEEREAIIRESMDCGGGCENCSSCWLGGGSPWDIYQDYIDGKREIREINAEYMEQYRQGRQIK